jgi:hypothetical protein
MALTFMACAKNWPISPRENPPTQEKTNEENPD